LINDVKVVEELLRIDQLKERKINFHSPQQLSIYYIIGMFSKQAKQFHSLGSCASTATGQVGAYAGHMKAACLTTDSDPVDVPTDPRM
jgi:succinyl-CoA synthetase alpha subunit